MEEETSSIVSWCWFCKKIMWSVIPWSCIQCELIIYSYDSSEYILWYHLKCKRTSQMWYRRMEAYTFCVTFQRAGFTLYFQNSWLIRTYWREKTMRARTVSVSNPVSRRFIVKSSTAWLRGRVIDDVNKIYLSCNQYTQECTVICPNENFILSI